jgi:hypothetical protein
VTFEMWTASVHRVPAVEKARRIDDVGAFPLEAVP